VKWEHRTQRRARPLLAVAGLLLAAASAACGAAPAPPAGVPTLTVGPSPAARAATATPTAVAPTPAAIPSATPGPATPTIPTDAQGFADPTFRKLWEASDRDIATGRVSRSWLWGPQPFAVKYEPYAQAPGGVRLVQYYDKSRMEINDPKGDRANQWFVTNGLLTSEMVAGRVQVGQDIFDNLEPAQVPVTGDLESPDPQTPRYADYTAIASARGGNRAPRQVGAAVTTRLARGGATEQVGKPPVAVKVTAYDDTLGHNLPDVFVDYFQGLKGQGLDWLFVTGYPISEPYWVTGRFGGETQTVLVQLFERRALTYNPRNKEGRQIEFANIGLHYYRWRYHDR